MRSNEWRSMENRDNRGASRRPEDDPQEYQGYRDYQEDYLDLDALPLPHASTSSALRAASPNRAATGGALGKRLTGQFASASADMSSDLYGYEYDYDAEQQGDSAAGRSTAQRTALQPADSSTGKSRAVQLTPSGADDAALAPLEPKQKTRRAVTIVPGADPARVQAISNAIQHGKPHKRHAMGSATTWGLALAVLICLMGAATPITRQVASSGLAVNTQLSANLASGQNANGPWNANAGSTTQLGIGGGAAPGVNAPGTAGIPVTITKNKPTPPPVSAPPTGGGTLPAPFSPWPPSNPYMQPPGYSSFGMSANGYYPADFGQCTWWAQYERKDENLIGMGAAMYWPGNAAARGYHVGYVPVAGATVAFQPGVQGAGGVGHVAHVVAVYPDGWFLVSEMNFYGNGGGWGRVDYRYAHTGGGVAFIY